MEEKNIEQNILDKDGNEKEFFYNVEDLKIKNENDKRKKIYKNMKEEYKLFRNQSLELKSDAISKHYEYVKEFYKIAEKEYDKSQERTKEDWKICDYFKNNINHKNKLIEISNLCRVKIDGIIAIQDDISNYKGELYIKEFGITLKVWTLVAKTWLKPHSEDGCTWDVHHITNAGYDNRPENLIWLKRCQHKELHPFMRYSDSCKSCNLYKEKSIE